MYQAPEVECYVMSDFCQYEGPSEQGGEVTPLGNENQTFEDIEADLSSSPNLWDE